MTGVSETLAGHVAILNLHGLSMEEKGVTHPASPQVYFEHLLETGFPKLQGVRDRTVHDLYLSSCLQTHIERDSRELYRVEKRREFEAFVRLCAFRIGQVINYQGLGREAMVSSATAKERLSLLEGGFLIKLVYPWVRNLAS